LFNVAGVLGDKTNTPGPEMNLSQLDQSWLQNQFAVNAIGPLMITSKLASLLKARKGRNKYLRETGSKESVVVNLSARVASMSDNTGGLAWYSYRMSKAALNAAGVSLANDLKPKGIAVGLFHPGFVQTEMVGGAGDIDTTTCATRLVERISELNLESTGQFVHSNGEILPW